MVNYLENFIPVSSYEVDLSSKTTIVSVDVSDLLFVTTNIKYHVKSLFNLLSNISGVDLIELKYRFVVVYDFLSVKFSRRLTLKIFVTELMAVPSLTNIFVNANWWEREVWDMFGIFFQNHPDLRRILTDYGFQGFPLRKDFPLSGYIEVQYDESTKKVEIYPLTLTQEMRKYSYENPWSQAENDIVLFSATHLLAGNDKKVFSSIDDTELLPSKGISPQSTDSPKVADSKKANNSPEVKVSVNQQFSTNERIDWRTYTFGKSDAAKKLAAEEQISVDKKSSAKKKSKKKKK